MSAVRHRVFAGGGLFFVWGVLTFTLYLAHVAQASAPVGREKDFASAKQSSEEMVETMLHTLALYIMASEAMAYLEDGSGDASKLAEKYSGHPGWIPAFEKASYDAQERVLYVPLGQCVWKIFNGGNSQLQSSLLQPSDSDLNEKDKQVLSFHLFQLMNDADIRNDEASYARSALAAQSLLYPASHPALRGSSQPVSHSRQPSAGGRKELFDCL